MGHRPRESASCPYLAARRGWIDYEPMFCPEYRCAEVRRRRIAADYSIDRGALPWVIWVISTTMISGPPLWSGWLAGGVPREQLGWSLLDLRSVVAHSVLAPIPLRCLFTYIATIRLQRELIQ